MAARSNGSTPGEAQPLPSFEGNDSVAATPSGVASAKSDSPENHAVAKLSQGLTPSDIICGRDKLSHSHCGNKRFRQIIEQNRERYQNAQSRDKKTEITCSIVAMIHSFGGRFLKLDESDGELKEISCDAAHEKVSHALRSAKDKSQPKIKRKRVVPKYVPTQEENDLYQAALAEQKRIYQQLIEWDKNGNNSTDFEDAEKFS